VISFLSRTQSQSLWLWDFLVNKHPADHTCLLADAAAFVARKRMATFVFIDSPDGRSMYAESWSKLGEEYASAVMSLYEKALGESMASFRLWEESDPGDPGLQTQVRTAMVEAVMPSMMPSTCTADPKEMREALAQREWGMCRNIIDLCRGKLSGKPRKRVVAIVGRSHVARLIALLKAV
jgi:hypothetical protein